MNEGKHLTKCPISSCSLNVLPTDLLKKALPIIMSDLTQIVKKKTENVCQVIPPGHKNSNYATATSTRFYFRTTGLSQSCLGN